MKKYIFFAVIISGYFSLHAQQQLRGTVLSKDNQQPLIGVSIIVKGTTQGTTTDENGRFQLNVPDNSTLLFSFIGFQTKEITYKGQSALRVILEEDVKALNEVTVQGFADMKGRARKRIESIQSIPETVIAMNAEQIEATGVNDVGSFLTQIPGINYGESQDPGTVMMNVRGIPQIRYGPSPIALIVDGIYFADPNLNVQTLYDIEQVEVIKGPQGIFYGKNAIGGAIVVTTKQPDNNFGGKAELGYGNGNAFTGGLSLSGPIAEDKLYFRLAGNYAKSDGLIKNTTLNKYVDFNRDLGIRGLLKYDFKPGTSLSIAGQYSSNKSGAITFISSSHNDDFPEASPNSYTGSPKGDFLGTGTLDSYFVSAFFETGFKKFRLTSATSYTGTKLFYDGDYLSTPIGVDNYGPQPLTTQEMTRASKVINQEIRFASTNTKSKFQWTAGLFYQNIRGEWNTSQYVNNDPTDFKYRNTTQVPITRDDNTLNSIGLFAFVEYDITDKLNISVGVRNEFEFLKNVETRSNKKSEKSYNALQPKASISYDITDGVMTYISFGGGFRSGGFNAAAIAPNATTGGGLEKFIRPEFTQSVEAGLKTKFWGNRAIVNVVGFYTSFQDQQVYRFSLADINNDGVPDNILGTYNMKQSRVAGFEAEVKLRLFKFLDLVGGYSYLNTEITEPGKVAGFDEKDSKGNKIPFTLEHSFSVSLLPKVKISDNLTLFGNIGVDYKGKKYWFADNLYGVSQSKVFQAPFALINLKVGARIGKHFGVNLWSRNIANTKYNNEWWPLNVFNFGDIRTPSQPRTFGGTVSYAF